MVAQIDKMLYANNNDKIMDTTSEIDLRVDSIFGDYFLDKKIYLIAGITKKRACEIMDISPDELTDYLNATHERSFRRAITDYRTEEALEIWERTPQATLTELSQAVGYSSVVLFLYGFICHVRCLPTTWRRRYM